MITLTGKDYDGFNVTCFIDPQSLVEQLPKPDISKIKEGDEVWLKGKIVKSPVGLQISGRVIKDIYGQVIKEEAEFILFHIPAPQEKKYPCAVCGKLRTKDEGGTTFTVCDECWKRKFCPQPTQEKELPDNNNTVDGQSLRRDINSILDYLKKREG